MPRPAALLLLAALAAAACGEGATVEEQVQQRRLEAIRAAGANEYGQARQDFTWVAEHATAPEVRFEALKGLYTAQLHCMDEPAAIATHDRLAAEYPARMDLKLRGKLVVDAVNLKLIDAANHALDATLDAFPDEKQQFAEVVERIDALSENPDAALPELGYVGG